MRRQRASAARRICDRGIPKGSGCLSASSTAPRSAHARRALLRAEPSCPTRRLSSSLSIGSAPRASRPSSSCARTQVRQRSHMPPSTRPRERRAKCRLGSHLRVTPRFWPAGREPRATRPRVHGSDRVSIARADTFERSARTRLRCHAEFLRGVLRLRGRARRREATGLPTKACAAARGSRERRRRPVDTTPRSAPAGPPLEIRASPVRRHDCPAVQLRCGTSARLPRARTPGRGGALTYPCFGWSSAGPVAGMGLNAQLPPAVPPSELASVGTERSPGAVSACATSAAHMAPWSLGPGNVRMAL